jgi:hypothetical protein
VPGCEGRDWGRLRVRRGPDRAAAPWGLPGAAMSEEVDKTVFKKYEIQTKLGKGVRTAAASDARTQAFERPPADRTAPRRRTVSCGRLWTRKRGT